MERGIFHAIRREWDSAQIDYLHALSWIPKWDSTRIGYAYCNLRTVKDELEQYDTALVHVRVRVEDDILITSILDEGTGIPKAIMNDIKEKHISTQLTVKGMGLHLVYLLVLEHGGQIRFNQKVDRLMGGVVVEIGKE